jgi:hypothetical protein
MMDSDDYLRVSEILVEIPFLTEETDKKRTAISNLSKLSYKEIVYQKHNRILVSELREPENHNSLNSFNSTREIY